MARSENVLSLGPIPFRKEVTMVTRMAMLVVGSCLVVGCRSSNGATPAAGADKTAVTNQAAAAPCEAPDAIKQVTVSEVADFVRTKSATILDANGSGPREEFGVIPGAILLSNYRTYALSELPAQKASKLVFYCGGKMCRASDGAAARATEAGYTDVSVLRDGIKGWRNAGQPTEMPRS
jgi:rhodanese-related sulfurtransferase